MKKLIEYITRKITSIKDIKAEKEKLRDVEVYTIRAPKEAMALLIGKEGRTIRAIRNLARVRAIIDNKKVAVELEEN